MKIEENAQISANKTFSKEKIPVLFALCEFFSCGTHWRDPHSPGCTEEIVWPDSCAI